MGETWWGCEAGPWNAGTVTSLPAPLHLESDFGTLTVYPYGAQPVEWVPTGMTESVLWLSPAAVLSEGTAIRGGVPVCFPWFGPGIDGTMKPGHGFARLTQWNVARAEVDEAGVAVVLTMNSSTATAPSFPYRYAADLSIRAASDLVIKFTVTNQDSVAFTFEEALHAYLAVSDVEQIVIEGLDEAPYTDKARGGAQAIQSGALRLTGETDRAYRSTADVVVRDRDRTLHVSKMGSASTIIWNPGQQLATTMSDIGADYWRGFVCVEAGNVLEDAIALEPGMSHTMTYSLRVQS